ncbi:MAG: thiamine pyrophosphate-binding protein [Alphaproteobacteria bacterium]|nr:thiamine pyrophosphate-binding protein [Alphaproteobacteria bacterium]
MNGGEALVSTLIAHGIETTYCVPGESYLTILEALRVNRNRIRLVLCRHESGAAFAAEAGAKVTGKPGIAFVTRGPGATNASIGLHTAKQDSTPLVLFIGHVPTREMGREAFQEIDYPKAFGPLTKKVIEVMRPEDCAAATADALATALDRRPGPVAVVLPEDVTEGDTRDETIPAFVPRTPRLPTEPALDAAAEMIRRAKHPFVIAGEMIGFEKAHDALATFAEASGAGVGSAFRRQDVIPADHAANLGNFGLVLAPFQKEYWKDVDLAIIVGARPDGCTIQDFELLRPDQGVIHIFPDRAAFHETSPTVAIEADAKPTLEALTRRLQGFSVPAERKSWRDKFRAEQVRFAAPGHDPKAKTKGAVDMAQIVIQLGKRLPKDSSIVNDSGAFASWFHRHYPYAAPSAQLAACLGSMGYGMPGALGAQLARPNKTVVAVMGDGGFLMTGQEIVTAVQQKLPIKVIVCDNGMYGSIATHQYRRAGRDGLYGTVMNSPDFAALARAYGAAAWTVSDTAGFLPALEAALAHKDGPALIHLKTDMRDLNATGPQMAE